MSIRVHSWFTLPMLTLAASALLSAAAPAQAADAGWNSAVQLGGNGGLYILAEPGDLWVEIEKADRNRSDNETHLRAIFFGPDRTVIDEQYIPDDGQGKGSGVGPVQRVRFSATVERAGVYGVNVTTTTDRYGTNILWGFSTNAEKYLVETSRGHKDERHQEPIVLHGGKEPGAVCFLPRDGAFEVNVSGLPATPDPVRLWDGTGTLVTETAVDENGNAVLAIPGGARENLPWHLELPASQGTVEVDGLTRWDGADGRYQNLSLWTPNPDSWFPFHENRWLLTPYRQRRNVTPGEEGTVQFEVHNNGRKMKAVDLALAFDGEPWACELSASAVEVAPGTSETVTLTYRAPEGEDARRIYLQAKTDGITTYSTLELTPETGQLAKPLDLPLKLEPYRHENAQFGYAPEYPVTNQVYFSPKNQPVATSGSGVAVCRDEAWHETTLGKLRSSKVAFDQGGDLYALEMQGGTPALAHSADGGASFTSYPIPGSATIDLEQFSGHNTPAGPPPFVRNTLTSRDKKLHWRRTNDLDLFVPTKKEDGAIEIGEPVRVSDRSIGMSSHSGIPSMVVSRNDKVHVTWAEATDPEEDVPGVPTFVTTYDRSTATLSESALVGYGPPANDVHNTPSITMDSQGYLHVLVGTHGRTFLYARSLQSNDASGGWTEPEPLGPGLRQTYVGFVCDQNDVLHVVFRLWHTDKTYFPAGHYASLSYMCKEPGKPWSESRPLVVAAFSEYSVFYHRLTIDQEGDLFLSYDYWSTFWFYRTDRRETRRALMTSADGGDTWKMATTSDLLP